MVSLNGKSLQELSSHALENRGASSFMARAVARMLVLADVQRLSIHGVSCVPTYCAFPGEGRADGAVQPRVAKPKEAVCLTDTADGLLHANEPRIA
jgi:LDH2 family malate/lactate/ureidoglycolate dehydrogenase